MKRKIKHLAAAAVAAIGIGTAIVVAEAGPAQAAVTNCTTWWGPSGRSSLKAKCSSTTNYAPYTTQFAWQGTCRNSGGDTHGVTTGWKNVGQTGTAQCAYNYHIASGFFIFR